MKEAIFYKKSVNGKTACLAKNENGETCGNRAFYMNSKQGAALCRKHLPSLEHAEELSCNTW
jgi:hypothetical protein